MKNGTVKFFNNSKGFGFIKDNESSEEYFVHITECVQTIRENDQVTFEVQSGKKD